MSGVNKIYHGDCMELLPSIPDASVDMVLCDLPYGTTQNKWDSVLPLDALWVQYKRVIKPDGVIVLFASQPFTTALINSNMKMFRYCWVWDKTKGGNFLLAKKQPVKSHEDICVFYGAQPTYNPQMIIRGKVRKKGGGRASTSFDVIPTISLNNEYYPTSILTYSTGSRKDHWHPTQKPLGLCEYLIKTYTNEGDIVLDNCLGSGTTAVACINTGRQYIGIEKEEQYFVTALERIKQAQGQYRQRSFEEVSA